MPGGQLQGALDEESAARFRLSTYEAGLKKQFTALHGTAMASLIIWGDLHAPGEPIPQPLYVRPIMQPFTQPGWDDLPPEERLDHEHTIGDGAVLVRREVQHRLGAGGCVLRGLREERARVDERRSTRPLDVHEAPRRREPASTVAAGSERRAVTVHSRRTTQRPAVGQSTLSFGGHRLRAQLVEASPCGSPAEVVSRLVAVQAQDPVAAKWAVGVRLPDGVATELSVEASLADGAILRTHVLRWTWQLVCPADVRWLLALVAPRLIDRYARRHRELGLDAAIFKKARIALEKALAHGEHLTRDELSAALARAGAPSSGPCLSHILAHAELQALICSGAPRGKKTTHALLDVRVPNARPALPREEALGELALRYFRSRGPATLADFAWWAGLTSAEASAGLADARSQLASEIVNGTTFWQDGAAARIPAGRRDVRAHLLPAFDEYLVAYKDREAVLAREHAKRINAGGGMLGPSVVLDGRVVGTWRRTLRSRTVEIELDLFESLAANARHTVEAARHRYGAFLEREARIVDGASRLQRR